MTIGPVPHRAATPLLGKVVVPHFWVVHLVSLIAPKRIEPIIWNWSQFENILEKNMVNFQNKGWGAPTEAPMDQKWPKLTHLEFFGFCHHLFHSGKRFLLLLH